MADYWKSLPRKFCDFCKCWITDNKPSIEFHERGKKHQENVQKRIAELRKKGQKDYEDQKNMQKMLKKMEEAALKSFKKDVELNPSLASEIPLAKTVETLPSPSGAKQQSPSQHQNAGQKKKKKKQGNRVWYEGISEEGYKYYWNSVTGVSNWDPPKEGYISLAEQENSGKHTHGTKNSLNAMNKIKKNQKPPASFGPQPCQAPYGQWVAVTDTPREEVDLELPEQKETVEFKVLIPTEETIKFKEKTVKTLGDNTRESGNIEFKKRKLNSNFKRNIRRKDDPDD